MKLYWKVKINGKWTFRAARAFGWTATPEHPSFIGGHIVAPYHDDENDSLSDWQERIGAW